MTDEDLTVNFNADISDMRDETKSAEELVTSFSENGQEQLKTFSETVAQLMEGFKLLGTEISATASIMSAVGNIKMNMPGAPESGGVRSGTSDGGGGGGGGRVAANKSANDKMNSDDAARENAAYKIALDGLAERKDLLEEEVTAGTRSKQSMYAAEKELEKERLQIEKDHWKKVMDLAGEGGSGYKAALQKSLTAEADSAKRMADINKAATKEIDADWKKLGDSISSTMASSIKGIITHTEKFRDVERQVTSEVLGHFIKMGTDMAEGFALSMIKSIMSSSAVTSAGVAGYLAPILGPGAIPAGAAAGAAVAALASKVTSSDVGAYNVPFDQLNLVHRGEMIMTAKQGDAFRKLMDAAGGSSGGVAPQHFHFSPQISAMDGESVVRALSGAPGKSMMDLFAKHTRRGATLGNFQ